MARARRIVVTAFMSSASCIGVLLGASIPAAVWPARLIAASLTCQPTIYVVLAHGFRRGVMSAAIAALLLFLTSGVQTPIIFSCVTAPVALLFGAAWRAGVPASVYLPLCAAARAAGSLLSLRLASVLLGEDLLGVAISATRAVLRATLNDHISATAVVMGSLALLSSFQTAVIALTSRVVAGRLATYDLPPPDEARAPAPPAPAAAAAPAARVSAEHDRARSMEAA